MGLDQLRGLLPSWAQSIDISKYFGQVLGAAGQGGAHSSLFLMFVMFIALTFLRRIAFFSLGSLMPLGLLGGLLYYGAGSTKGAVSTLSKLPGASTSGISPLGVCLLIVAGLYLLGRFRFVSLGSAVALMIIGLVLSGHTPQLPDRFASASSSELLVIVAGLACVLLFLRVLWQRSYTFVPVSAGPGYPVTFMPVSPLVRFQRILLPLRVLGVCVALACLAVLYFWPEEPQRYFVWWKAAHAPYAFILSLICLPFLIQGPRFLWPKSAPVQTTPAMQYAPAVPIVLPAAPRLEPTPLQAQNAPAGTRLDLDLGRVR
jgi:hypothetical protein